MMSSDPFLRRHPDRREFLTVGMGMFVALSLPLALRRHTTLVKRTFPVMGTIAEVQVAHRDVAFAESAIDAAIVGLEFGGREPERDFRGGRLRSVRGVNQVAKTGQRQIAANRAGCGFVRTR